MPKEVKSYYTAGELATIFGITKQALLYYDKRDILKPEFISDNNYRHYSMNQYMLLEIIIALRKLDVSIEEIKDYLNNRNPDSLEELLVKKQTTLEEQIRTAEAATAKITSMRKKINHARLLHCGKITLEHRHKQTIIVSDLASVVDDTERITIYARHNLELFDSPYFKEKATGWVVSSDGYFNHDNRKAMAYYTTVNSSYAGSNATILAAGLYLSIHYKGIFHSSGHTLKEMFNDFLERNRLRVVSNIYCMPLIDHWLANKETEYITRISMQVEYID